MHVSEPAESVEPDHHDALSEGLHWRVPAAFNIAEACCGRWARDAATRGRVAVVHERADGRITRISYAELQSHAHRLAHALERLGLQRGERVALLLPQRPETAVAHIAIQQLGAVAMPLSMLFGPEALAYRLQDSEARVAIVEAGALAKLRAARAECPRLEALIVVADAAAPLQLGEADWTAALAREPAVHAPVATAADDGAILIYTSGTTGPPKGALIPQRALIGNLPGFVCSQNGFDGAWTTLWPDLAAASAASLGRLSPARGNGEGAGVNTGHRPTAGKESTPGVFSPPADWAWTGGLMDALLPTLFFGRTILGAEGRFAPLRAFELMQCHRVTHSFLFPTALKAMMKAVPAPRERYALELRAVMSAGEAVGDAVFAWVEQALGLTVNEMFGQTEVNYIVGNCAGGLGAGLPGWPARAGSMGRAYPGHRIAVIDDEGREVPRGTPGDVALHRLDRHGAPDPIFFLGYWRNEGATRAKFSGDPADSWCRTGDTATMDADGYLWYQGRSDDVFKVAGYRIGPSEIENCLVKHPAVANAAVVPKPDAERGALVKAYVVLAPGHEGDAALVEALQQHVKGRLAPYEYPKEIEFVEALPMTTTGKVQRRVLRLQEEERARRAGGG